MERVERETYKKKIELYKKLGAEDFQKVVFKVEEIKFKVLKKLIPNFIDKYDRYCDKLRKKLISRTTTEEEVKEVNKYINSVKLRMRREYNTEQSINYHMNSDQATEIYNYLLWNKDVHKSSLAKDLILMPITAVGSIFLTPWLTPLLAYEMFSAFIDFECINIQNYNICRYKLVEDKLREREERKIKTTNEEYGDIAEIISTKMEESEKLPSMTEIIDNLESKEQVEKLRRILIEQLQSKQIEKNKLLVRGNK